MKKLNEKNAKIKKNEMLPYLYMNREAHMRNIIYFSIFFNFDLNEVNKCIWTRQPDR